MGLILASTSPVRATLLRSAGVAFDVAAPAVDEGAVQAAHRGDGAELALSLARAKALSVAAPGALVLGSDSTLSIDGTLYSKPRDRAEAAAHLRSFSGRTMLLSSAAALARDGQVAWNMVDTARLHVRDLSAEFIDSYLDAEWPAAAYCVGVFRMEGRGVTLFERVEGSHFTILGLPLLPLLAALRARGEMAA